MTNLKASGARIYQIIYYLSFILAWTIPFLHPFIGRIQDFEQLKSYSTCTCAVLMMTLLITFIKRLKDSQKKSDLVLNSMSLVFSAIILFASIYSAKFFLELNQFYLLILSLTIQTTIALEVVKSDVLKEFLELFFIVVIGILCFGILGYQLNFLILIFITIVGLSIYSLQAGIRQIAKPDLYCKRIIAISYFIPALALTYLCLLRFLPMQNIIALLLIPYSILLVEEIQLGSSSIANPRRFLTLNTGHNLLFLAIMLYTSQRL